MQDQNDKWARKIEDLFLFFAASQMKHCFMEHIYYLVKQCKTGSVRFLISLFSGEGILLIFCLFLGLYYFDDNK